MGKKGKREGGWVDTLPRSNSSGIIALMSADIDTHFCIITHKIAQSDLVPGRYCRSQNLSH